MSGQEDLPAGQVGQQIDAPAYPPEQRGPVLAGADQTVGGAVLGGGWPPAPDHGESAPRPTEVDPQQLGFTPREPVPWLGPILLAGTAVRVVLADLFGAYLDKRELQGALPATVHDERNAGPDGELTDQGDTWVDFVADVGDGFNATYSIAYLLAQPELAIDGAPLPRGRLLVLGGDQVYPTASGQQYEDRFKGPYRAAMPEPPAQPAPRPTLYALPGNHDWYDGLTAFLRLFARAEDGRIGGWQTKQSRSYFAIQLPQRWWLYAIDAQYGAYLDDPQLRYFRDAAEQLRAGDRVILCAPTPSWVQAANAENNAYDTIDYFVRRVIGPTGAEVRLMLSGDLHHYARYSGEDRELITCGGGGAYLSATHCLPEKIQVPPSASLVRTPSPPREYTLAGAYPTKRRSRAYAAGVFARLPWRNQGFVTGVGIVHLLLMLAMSNAASQQVPGTLQRLATIPLILMLVIVLGSTVAFALPAAGGRRKLRHWLLGFGHGFAHIGLAALGTWAWLSLPLPTLVWPLPLLTALVLYLPAVGFAASLVVSLYLLFASLFQVNVNELFAGQAIIDSKAFLRMHIRADGTLRIYPIAVDRVGRRWVPHPDAPADEPWLEPEHPLAYRLAEPPITIR